MTTIYTLEMLKQMKGQAVKDVWHSMIGKPPGIKNTTGLRNSEEIIQAILKGQADPEYRKTFTQRAPKPQADPIPEEETMGRKKKVEIVVNPIVPPTVRKHGIHAIESTDIPLCPGEVVRKHLRKLHVGEVSYFLDVQTKELYSIVENKPGFLCGIWNAEERQITSQ